MLDAIFQPFVNGSPITLMAAAAVERLLSAPRLNALFERSRQGQYAHALMFSTLFHLMAGVVSGTRRSIHHAYQSAADVPGVSVVAVYDKLKGVETCTSQALVRELAADVAALIDEMDGGALPPLAPGYPVKILDGNCVAATEHRIKELRPLAAGALPGKSLVVLDAQRRLMADVFPCEDGHAQERALLDQVLPTVAAGELWVEDRNFCTFDFLHAIDERGAFFITRQHGNMACEPLGERRAAGTTADGGVVYEQRVRVAGAGRRALHLRRVEVHLPRATRDGDRVLRLLSNLPADGPHAVDAVRVAELYRARWRIEGAFQELAEHLNSEVRTLGYPRAALFGFCVALVLFNAMSLMKAALRACHGAAKVEAEVSNYYIAAELETTSRGMLIAIPPERWRVFAEMTAAQFVAAMLMLAGKVDLRQFKKHPRGPKRPQPKRAYDPAHPHVSTARLLELRGPRKRRTI
jgi:IS4 transposase